MIICVVSTYEVVRGLRKVIYGRTSIMYGLEMTAWSTNELYRPDVVQNKAGRVALGGNRYVALEAGRGDIWDELVPLERG